MDEELEAEMLEEAALAEQAAYEESGLYLDDEYLEYEYDDLADYIGADAAADYYDGEADVFG